MKKIVTLLTLCICFLHVEAQFFPYQGSIPVFIPDSNINVDIPIIVSGLPAQIDSTFGLAEVCLDIIHPQVSDLKIALTSPDGNTILISMHNGSGGANFPGTCFQMNAGVSIGAAIAPFFGSFIPDESLNMLNNGQDPNGTWTLHVIDVFPTFSGVLNNLSITFSINPPPDPTVIQGVCSTTNASGCICKDTTLTDCDLFPDLICSYIIIRDGWNEYQGSVDLPNAVIDIGSGPVEMRPTNDCYCDTVNVLCSTAFCPDGNPPKERVNQRIYHKNSNGQMTFYDTPAGNQSFHASHNHVHAEDFTEFSIRIPTIDPDPSTWPVIGKSVKQGYCMINMGDCNSMDSICMSHGNVITNSMMPNFNLGTVTGCGSQGQGIFVGRYDLYGPGFGQTIPLTNICNGDYYLVTTIDPLNHFIEEDETNNSIAIPVHLTKQVGVPLPAGFTYSSFGLTAGFFNYTPGVIRTWDFGDGTVIVDPLPSHTFPAAGTYIVKLTVYDSICSASTAQTVIIGNLGTGLNPIPTGLNNVSVYPNPSESEFTISYDLVNPGSVKIEMYNVMGSLLNVLKSKRELAGKHDFDVNVSTAGSYLIRISTNDQVVNKKVTILK